MSEIFDNWDDMDDNHADDVISSVVKEEQHDLGRNPEGCSDGGTCHHDCRKGCFREKYCTPLSGSGLNDDWTPKED